MSDATPTPHDLSPLYSRMVTMQLSRRSSEDSLRGKIPAEQNAQEETKFKAKASPIRGKARPAMFAELDSCGARRCAVVADGLSKELAENETYKPQLIA